MSVVDLIWQKIAAERSRHLLGWAVHATVDGKRVQLPVVNKDGTWARVPDGVESIGFVNQKAAFCGARCINTITTPTSDANARLLAQGCSCCLPRGWRMPIAWDKKTQ